MRKIVFLLGLLLWAVGAGAAQSAGGEGSAELYADRFESEGDLVRAEGHVVLAYEGTLFLGDRASYDRKADVIVLEGDVEILSDRGSKVLADRVVFEVGKNRVTFSDFYHTDRDDIWIYADEAEKSEGNYSLRNSVLSSCSMEDPDWSVKFGEAVYDSKTKYMRLKDVKIYAKDVPVLYTPYLGFSMERERHSGLLMPHFGIGGDEGFFYEQPYFWAISPSMDMEFNPSIRTERGYGLYGTFRFMDSPWSGGQIRAGYFRDKDSFVREHNLANRDHYGVEFLYESTNVLRSWKPEGYRDGLYVNIDLFNDIDYHNLQFSSLDHLEESSRFKESRLNYFLYNDEQYFGFRMRYFIDTTSEENNETIQELPALQYHKYSSALIDGLVDYSVDARLYNFWREDGTRAIRGVASLPLEFRTSLFGDYLNLSITEELSASDTKFFEESSLKISDNHYAAAVLNHNIELSSDLIRGYESGVHTMILSALFTKSTLLAEGNMKYNELNDELINDYNLDMIYDSRIALKMHHFWESYENDFKMEYLAVADYYPENDSRWNLLRQEFHLDYGHYRFSSRLDYSVYRHSIAQFSNSFSYSDEVFGFELEHTRKESTLYEDAGDSWRNSLDQHEISLSARYRSSELLTWYGGYTFDFKEDASKNWHAGVLIDRKCWNFKVVFEQKRTPVLTKEGEGSIRENKIYFQFNLVPFGGTGSVAKTSI
jgi:LPS-assembly protein